MKQKSKHFFKSLVVAQSLLLTQAFAADDLCGVKATSLKKVVDLPTEPSYFISANPINEQVGVIMNGGNYILDMKTGTRRRVPGAYDPVFTPDGRWLTLPDGRFLNAQDKDIYMSDANLGSYQSVGILDRSRDGDKVLYRYITADGFEDVEIDGKTEKSEMKNNGKFMGLGSLPMVSTDGKYISFLNEQTNTTKIHKINDDGSVTEILDLGVATGKVSFDKTSSRVTFHVDRMTSNNSVFSGIGKKETKDIFVVDFDKENVGKSSEAWSVKNFKRISNSKESGTGTYYPRFRNDGTIVAVTKDNKDNFQLSVFDPALLTGEKKYALANSKDITSCGEDHPELSKTLALGILWAEICSELEMSPKDYYLQGLNLEEAACKKLVAKKADVKDLQKKVQNILDAETAKTANTSPLGKVLSVFKPSKNKMSLSIEDLLAACPKLDSKPLKNVQIEHIGNKGEVEKATGESTYASKCAGCHDDTNFGAPVFKEINKEIAEMMYDAVFNRHIMPKNGHLDDEEADLLKTYLKGFISSPQPAKPLPKSSAKKHGDDHSEKNDKEDF